MKSNEIYMDCINTYKGYFIMWHKDTGKYYAQTYQNKKHCRSVKGYTLPNLKKKIDKNEIGEMKEVTIKQKMYL